MVRLQTTAEGYSWFANQHLSAAGAADHELSVVTFVTLAAAAGCPGYIDASFRPCTVFPATGGTLQTSWRKWIDMSPLTRH